MNHTLNSMWLVLLCLTWAGMPLWCCRLYRECEQSQVSKAKTKLHPFPLLFSFSSQISLTEKPAITVPTVDLIGIWSIQGYTLSNWCLRFFLRQFTCAETWNTVYVHLVCCLWKHDWIGIFEWFLIMILYHITTSTQAVLSCSSPPPLFYKSELTKTKQ